MKRSLPGASRCEPSDASPPPGLGRLARTRPCSTRWATVPSASPITTPPPAKPTETPSSQPKRCSCHPSCPITALCGPYARITSTTFPRHRPQQQQLQHQKMMMTLQRPLLSSPATIGCRLASLPSPQRPVRTLPSQPCAMIKEQNPSSRSDYYTILDEKRKEPLEKFKSEKVTQ